jgi:hypothetical protein
LARGSRARAAEGVRGHRGALAGDGGVDRGGRTQVVAVAGVGPRRAGRRRP